MVAALAALVLLPNLVELPPSSIQVHHERARDLLRFTSTAANVGAAPLVVVSTRRASADAFVNYQVIGGRRSRIDMSVAYRRSGGHDHFHLLAFERYELRDQAGKVLLVGHKAGFCLGDRIALGPNSPKPRWRGSCRRRDRSALTVAQGLSSGYADAYDAELGGQALDVTGLPAGDYVLVNEVDPLHRLSETSYDDNAASVRFRLLRPPAPAGIAFVHVLGTCRSGRCSG